MMKKLFRYFLQGLLYGAPFGLTIYFVYVTFNFADSFLRDLLNEIFGIYIPGIGIISIIIFVTLVGYIGETIIAQPIKMVMQRLMAKAPMINMLYSSLRDLFSAFVGSEKKFNHPVLVTLNNMTGVQRIGFITQKDLSDFEIHDKVAVYFPLSYSFAGDLYIVPKESVITLNISSAEAMKFIVSGGVTNLKK